ncbi:MAG TPA: Crp/Fnr family transcriptional regulator [Candidatus Dormibacteraeota bacterium]|nr:Crp/Fnr family transcriptional regulator [Candidatus Dormibacteraeota bacterium]
MEAEGPPIREVGDTGFRHLGLNAVAGRGFMGRLTPDLIDELVQGAHSAWYPVGAILPPALQGSGPALVLAGRLRFYLSAPDGRQLTVHYAQPGDIVGTVIRDQSHVTARLEVLRPATLLHLDEERVRSLVDGNVVIAHAMLEESLDRLRSVYRLLAARAFTSVRVRVARDLVELADMSGGLAQGTRLSVTHQSLADATGSVREVVARAIRDLRHESVIATDSEGITVLDPPALKRAAGL